MKIKLPDKFKPMFKPKRVKTYFGGRGGAKTESFSRVALIMAMQGKRFLCLREFMNSIEDSVHATLKSIIHSDGFSGFEILNNEIRHISGGGFKYGQLARNLASIKSKHDFDVAWVEEAETVSAESIEELEPTIRKGESELWYSFNPAREDGAVYTKYVLPNISAILSDGYYEDDHTFVCKVGLEDNPWAPQELIDLSARMREENYDNWLHVWGGEPRRDLDDVIIQPKWIDAAIDAHKKLGFEPIGVKSMGFDPADDGKDAKAVAMRHGSVITNVKQWDHGDIEEAINRAFSYAYDWRAEFIVFDADGLGAAVKVGLDKRTEGKNIEVDAYHGGAGVDNPRTPYMEGRSNKDTFRNKRAQYWWLLRDRFEATYRAVKNGQYTDPEKLISLDSDGIEDMLLLKSELSRPTRKRTDNSLIQLESKQKMTDSPNMADAVVMAFANSSAIADDVVINFEGWG